MVVPRPAAPQGRLEDAPLAHVLSWARDARATGCVTFKSGGAVNRLYLSEGRPAGTVLSAGYRPLPQLLLELGWLDELALDRALEEVYGGVPLEQALVKTGALGEDRLQEALELQEERNLEALGALTAGEIEFKSEPLPPSTKVRLSPERALLDALALPSGHARTELLVQSLGAHAARLNSALEGAVPALKLRDDERKALELLRPGMTAADFERDSGLPAGRARALVALLIELELVTAVDLVAEAEAIRQKAEAERKAALALQMARESELLENERNRQAEAAVLQLQDLEGERLVEEERYIELRAAREQEKLRVQQEAAKAAQPQAWEEHDAFSASLEAATQTVTIGDVQGAADGHKAAYADSVVRAEGALAVELEADARARQAWTSYDAERHSAEQLAREEAARVEEVEQAARLALQARIREREEEARRQAEIAELEAQARRIVAEQRAKAEAEERLTRERAEEEARIARENAEREEAERTAREKAEREEAERIARENAEREEAERIARENAERDEAERIARENAEREEAERVARENAEREEAERIAREKAEREEAERIAREKAEAEAREAEERLARERAEALARDAEEREARERAEAIAREEAKRVAREKAERDEAERLAQEKAEAEHAAKEAAIHAARELADRVAREEEERLAQEKAAREKEERRHQDEIAQLEAHAKRIVAEQRAKVEAEAEAKAREPLTPYETDRRAMLAARKNVEIRLAGQRDEARKRAQRETDKLNGNARPKSLSPEEAQREIQRRFEEQAKQWLREEQSHEPSTVEDASPSNLEESLQRQLRDGLTSDLESLLTASLKPPPRPTTRPPSGAAAVRTAAPRPGSTGAPIPLTNARPTSKGGPIPLTNARPTSTGARAPSAAARPTTEPNSPPAMPRPPSMGARPPSANAARPTSKNPARPTSGGARPPSNRDKFEFTFDSLGTAGSNVSPADVESIWDDPVGEDMGNDEEARARRARLRRLGMQNTGLLPSSGGSSTPHEPPAAPAPASATPAAPASASGNTMESIRAAPPAASVDDTALGKEIEARYARLKTEDYFSRLGISKNTNAVGAKAAFVELAKRFHPDKLPPSLAHLSDKTREVFAAIREAYDTLTNDTARSDYMKKMARPPTPMAQKPGGAREVSGEAQLEAKKMRTLAEIALRKKAFVEAEGHFAKAYEIEQHANDLAAQAWCVYLDPARKKESGIIDRLLKQAFAKDATCERAHYVSGVIARAANDMDKAEMHFRAAVKVNPNNQDAALELRVIERRKQKGGSDTPPPGGKKKGFFGL